MQAAFERLIVKRLNGRALDDNKNQEAAAGRYPDFACFRDLVLIEMKHLETDQRERVNSVFQTKVRPEERPIFYGDRDGHHIIDRVSNGAEVKSAIVTKLAGTIEQILRSANEQFASYTSRHPRKNRINICVILNSTLREFAPDMVIHAIYRKEKKSGDVPRFPAIDAILYFSEKHFKILPDGRIGYAVGIYDGPGVLSEPWKKQFVDRVVEEWSHMRTGSKSVPSEDASNFDVVDDIPKNMSRSDTWYLEYRRNPYMGKLPTERLKVLFNRCVAQNALTFMKGKWPKPAREVTEQRLRFFTHLIEETNRRGIDMRDFSRDKLNAEQRTEVYADLPSELVHLLSGRNEQDSNETGSLN